MSIDLVAATLWLPMEPARKLVLIALSERADIKTGRCWPGREEIAARASLSPRRVTPHLAALKAAGYIKRDQPGNFHRGETTIRILDVKRILEEGEAARQAFLMRRATSRDESSHVPTEQGTLRPTSGDVDGIDHGTFEIDQGTLATRSGDVAAIETVIEPSTQPSRDPSEEPSCARGAPALSSSSGLANFSGGHR